MKDKYTIYCTKEQTRKALELGAPICQHPFESSIIKANERMFSNLICVDEKYFYIPTAEEMIGWFEEQGIAVYAFVDNNEKEYTGWSYEIVKDFKNGGWKNTLAVPDTTFNSYKEATLAAIDVALEYFANNNLIK